MRGKPAEGTADQSRQLPAVAAGQMPAGQGDLLLDEIEVVEQPGLCRHDPLSRGGGRGDHLVGLEKDALVLVQPGEQPVFPGPPIDAVAARQRDGVVLQLIAAEEFRAQQSHIRARCPEGLALVRRIPSVGRLWPRPLVQRENALLDSVRLRGTSPSERMVGA